MPKGDVSALKGSWDQSTCWMLTDFQYSITDPLPTCHIASLRKINRAFALIKADHLKWVTSCVMVSQVTQHMEMILQ